MGSKWFTSTFLNRLKFPQNKEGDLISWGEPILQNSGITWSPLLYFNFRNLEDANSSSFIRFQWVLRDSAVLSSVFWNFLQLKRGDLISWGNQFCRTAELFGTPLLYFNCRNLNDPNSLSFIRFQWVLYNSPVPFSIFWNFLRLKMGDLISWTEPILQNGRIIWSPVLYFNPRNLKDPNSLSFIRFQ